MMSHWITSEVLNVNWQQLQHLWYKSYQCGGVGHALWFSVSFSVTPSSRHSSNVDIATGGIVTEKLFTFFLSCSIALYQTTQLLHRDYHEKVSTPNPSLAFYCMTLQTQLLVPIEVSREESMAVPNATPAAKRQESFPVLAKAGSTCSFILKNTDFSSHYSYT